MLLIASLLLSLLSAAVFLIPALLLGKCIFRWRWRRAFLIFVFSSYLCVVYELTGLPNICYINVDVNLNLIPFLGIFQDYRSSALNVLLFLPMGFLLPFLSDQFSSQKCAARMGMCVSFLIEVLQLLTLRATDVNDLITNTLGALLGYRLAAAVKRGIPTGMYIDREEKPHGVSYAVAASVIVMFFLHPFVYTWLWRMCF